MCLAEVTQSSVYVKRNRLNDVNYTSFTFSAHSYRILPTFIPYYRIHCHTIVNALTSIRLLFAVYSSDELMFVCYTSGITQDNNK